MSPELHQLLLRTDVRGAWEHPPGANWPYEISRVRKLMPELESVLQAQLSLDEGVQDASFFADLGVLVQQTDPNGIIHLCYSICFRFSWFGNLVSLYGEDSGEYNATGAVRVLEEHGFTYVPAAELGELYDGINPPYEPTLTWWVRYFDYL